MRAVVSGCMYPFMNCANQMMQAKRLCRDDGYWIRRVEDFQCTGGFIGAKTAAEEKWQYVDHFLLSLVLLVAVVLLGLFARAQMLKHAPQLDRRLSWLKGAKEAQEEHVEKGVYQVTI